MAYFVIVFALWVLSVCNEIISHVWMFDVFAVLSMRDEIISQIGSITSDATGAETARLQRYIAVLFVIVYLLCMSSGY